jgi:1-pyrroline-5-carboxylate dehydrogenase
MAVRPFSNEPVLDFRIEANALLMRAALEKVRGELGREYDLVIGSKRSKTSDKIRSLNPARPSEVVGVHQKAGVEHVEPAMQAALAAFESWKNVPVEERSGLLLRTADIIRKRKPEFNAWMVLEVGKNWDEAEADTCEAIDFLEFYARLALHMAQAEPAVQLPGERDALRYIALGVGAVIPPWNFPLAIMAGMTVAAVVCGNTVVLKPSSDSPTVAVKFFEAMEEAGLPPGVVNFCPGAGATFGNGLVEHPKTRFIAFTGSRDVGLDINVRAAQHRPGQLWIKRTILEMGGKDSILVAADADLDAAVEGVAASAFGFQGQKCSACSRAIVDASLYDRFLDKLQARVAKIRIGDPAENAPAGPVVNAGALKSISDYIAIGAKEVRVIIG